MPNRVKSKVRRLPNQWDVAIQEAERQLNAAKQRVKGLERAVENWKRLRDGGMPWPESNATESPSA